MAAGSMTGALPDEVCARGYAGLGLRLLHYTHKPTAAGFML